MTARKPKPEAANGIMPKLVKANGTMLTEAVQTSVDALTVGPADVALVKLALVLAQAIDSMSDEVKGRMLAQTTPQLLATLRELRLHVPAPRPPSKWDEMRPGAVAARGIGGR